MTDMIPVEEFAERLKPGMRGMLILGPVDRVLTIVGFRETKCGYFLVVEPDEGDTENLWEIISDIPPLVPEIEVEFI
jgi:hypothetical protein